MRSMSTDYADKLLQIRKAENLTQKKFSQITGIAIGTIQKYESGHQSARAEIMEKVLQVDLFEKYTLWLIHGKTAEAAGQIAPPAEIGVNSVEPRDRELISKKAVR
ncbi:helix-turn-helix domain-containing protein [Enterobacter ludwigii]|uniref:helix-turn-helix domain-containing protein n=1 Tax=Enterobacter ludwigii TaxID=299767 RepID=UPI0018668DEF|nr:helix-turn-helix transcriptional regulator [Enterobacter ludwigii]